MIAFASTAATTGDAYWWQGSLMTIKARAADTGGALGLVEGLHEGFGPPLHVHHHEDEGMLVPKARSAFGKARRVRRWPRHSGLGAARSATPSRCRSPSARAL